MKALSDLWNRVVRSVFRIGLPKTNLGRAQVMVSSFLLHLHPAKVRRDSLRPSKTFGLGLISVNLFLILIVTGVLLMFDYVPSVERAYDSMKDLEFVVTAGVLLRNCHRWAAHLMVITVLLHMARVFFMGSYKKPREFNWTIGIVLLLLTLFLSFTGYLLPWDQLAFWAITVGTSIAGYAPVVGDATQYLLLGGNMVDQPALLRFYVLHVVVLPVAAIFLIAVHLYRVRKDGGLARPDEDEIEVVEGAAPPTGKSYGLMALTSTTSPHVGKDPHEEVFSWPHLLMREVLLFAGTFGLVLILALLFDAPLEEIANPVHPPNPAKAPWYFLALQELVAYSALVGGVVVPVVLIVALLAIPFIDRSRSGPGQWFAGDRKLLNTVFLVILIAALVLTLVGMYFRGPNWDWVWPWQSGPGQGGH